jgi:enterochelin esterase-like enzyme
MIVTRKRQLHRAMLLWVLLVACVCAAHASDVVTFEFDSKTLARRWSYTVYLPDGYRTSELRYPVFYLLHGNAQKHTDWVVYGRIQPTADAAIASGKIPPTIIVMPDAGTTWYVDRKEKMETAFLEDLLPEIEARFRTIADRNGRVVGGLSMGGYGALRFALKYPEKFAAAALLSPAIYEPEPPQNSSARRVGVFGAPEYDARVWQSLNYPSLLEAYFAKKQPVPMYIHSGDDDEYLIEADATKLYSLLRARGQPAELRIVDGAHDWGVWQNAIGEAMTYIYRFAARPRSN